ncbi:MAG: response regulator transcription factor [Planctomycetota bacterium]
MERHIIVVEDEPDLAELIALHLRRENLKVSVFGDGNTGMEAIEREVPCLVVLDLMLPGLDGFEICRRIRRSSELGDVQVLMVTARGEETDVVTGLALGADDYITKPFRPRVLVARVRNLLRRPKSGEDEGQVLRASGIEVDVGRHEVRVEGEVIAVTHTEFEVLRYLASPPGRVRSRAEVLECLDQGTHVLERTVDVHVAALRRKLGELGKGLETVRGVGYRLRD